MSHADDGTLHAYLDGELSAMEVVRVEAHLAECAPCRARLEEGRVLLRRAGEILARAEPPPSERPVPSLEALRSQRIRWVTPLAWAATAVIVLGAGWFTRAALRDDDASTRSAAPPPAVFTEEPARQAVEPLVARQDEAKAEADTTAVPGARHETPPDDLAEAVIPATDSARRLALAPAPPANRAVPSVQDTAAPDSVERRRMTDSAAAPARGVVREAEAAPRPLAGAVSAGRALTPEVPRAWPPITTDSARALLGSEIVIIPELPLRGIRGSVQGDSVVLVEQGSGTDPGVTVRLYQRRAGAAADRVLLSSELLARYIGPLRVEILGPLPADSLSKLLEKARPIR